MNAPATVGTLVDVSKLRILDGIISYRIYAQDGSMIPMTIEDAPHNRRFVAWVQIHDRYVVHGAKK